MHIYCWVSEKQVKHTLIMAHTVHICYLNHILVWIKQVVTIFEFEQMHYIKLECIVVLLHIFLVNWEHILPTVIGHSREWCTLALWTCLVKKHLRYSWCVLEYMVGPHFPAKIQKNGSKSAAESAWVVGHGFEGFHLKLTYFYLFCRLKSHLKFVGCFDTEDNNPQVWKLVAPFSGVKTIHTKHSRKWAILILIFWGRKRIGIKSYVTSFFLCEKVIKKIWLDWRNFCLSRSVSRFAQRK